MGHRRGGRVKEEDLATHLAITSKMSYDFDVCKRLSEAPRRKVNR